MNARFLQGMKHGLPIMLGYLSVSFGFGIRAVQLGFSVFTATAISATNLTSAGQAMGIQVAANCVNLMQAVLEMILTQLVINLRYSLMGISLSQKLSPTFTTRHRLLASFGITDEIFAVAVSQPFAITPAYLYGMIAVSVAGWTAGTFLGAAAGQLLPAELTAAMGILLYGMFLAIIIPPARKQKPVLLTVLIAAAFSTAFYYGLPTVPSGFAVILSALAAAALTAWWFPVKEAEE